MRKVSPNKLQCATSPNGTVFYILERGCYCNPANYWSMFFDIDRCEVLYSDGEIGAALYHGVCLRCGKEYTIMHRIVDPIRLFGALIKANDIFYDNA